MSQPYYQVLGEARLQYSGKAGLKVPLEIGNLSEPRNWQDDTSSVSELKISLNRYAKMRIRGMLIRVPFEIWNSWKPKNWQDNTFSVLELKLPIYLLRLMESRVDDREFEVRENGLQQAGQHIIIESIGDAGVVFLVTLEGQSEFSISCHWLRCCTLL